MSPRPSSKPSSAATSSPSRSLFSGVVASTVEASPRPKPSSVSSVLRTSGFASPSRAIAASAQPPRARQDGVFEQPAALAAFLAGGSGQPVGAPRAASTGQRAPAPVAPAPRLSRVPAEECSRVSAGFVVSAYSAASGSHGSSRGPKSWLSRALNASKRAADRERSKRISQRLATLAKRSASRPLSVMRSQKRGVVSLLPRPS